MNLPIIIVALIGGVWVLRQAGRMDPRKARSFVIGWGALLFGAWMSVTHGIYTGLPILAIGAGMLGYGNLTGFMSKAGTNPNQAPMPPQTSMDRTEAYHVLGLEPGASRDEINAAYKRLQRANHPDAGGSTYLAAKINQARDLLLRGA